MSEEFNCRERFKNSGVLFWENGGFLVSIKIPSFPKFVSGILCLFNCVRNGYTMKAVQNIRKWQNNMPAVFSARLTCHLS